MAESNAHDFSFSTIDGAPLPLAAFRGKPVLLVNTASFCGYTPQYADLEALHQRYAPRGLVVLGVPSNDFGAQEPGTAAEIKTFCSTNYRVTFPLAAKVHVISAEAEAHPLYRWIEAELGEAGVPRWNFHKYLIAPDGSLAGAWPSAVKPQAAEIVGEIERLLA
jgi:glutathione peroxidase